MQGFPGQMKNTPAPQNYLNNMPQNQQQMPNTMNNM